MNKKRAVQIISINALIFPIFFFFFYSKLPETIPMQFSLSGEVNWSLPLNVGLFAFAMFFIVYVGQILVRFKDDATYPKKDTAFAILLPELFIIILIIAMIIK
jgi:hypothetical protein